MSHSIDMLMDVVQTLEGMDVPVDLQMAALQVYAGKTEPDILLGSRGFYLSDIQQKHVRCFGEDGYLRPELIELGQRVHVEPLTLDEFIVANVLLYLEGENFTLQGYLKDALFGEKKVAFDLSIHDMTYSSALRSSTFNAEAYVSPRMPFLQRLSLCSLNSRLEKLQFPNGARNQGRGPFFQQKLIVGGRGGKDVQGRR